MKKSYWKNCVHCKLSLKTDFVRSSAFLIQLDYQINMVKSLEKDFFLNITPDGFLGV